MTAPTAPMPAALAPYVATMGAYDLGPGLGGVHRGLPSSTVSITIPESDAFEVAWSERPGSRTRLHGVVAGLHLDPAELTQAGCTRGVFLTLNPLGTRALLGIPASALAGHAVDLADAAPAMAHLPERLAACRSWPQRRALVVNALLMGLARHGGRADHGGLRAALAALAATTRVQEAAHLLGYTRRRLSTTVRAEFGVTPKEYQRLVRFEAVRGRLVAAAGAGTGGGAGAWDGAGVRAGAGAGEGGLAALAAESGFADQAHLTREWRAMAGCTPTEWLCTEVHAVQSPASESGPPGGKRTPD